MTADHTPREAELQGAEDDWAEPVGELKAERDHEMLQRLAAEAEPSRVRRTAALTQGPAPSASSSPVFRIVGG